MITDKQIQDIALHRALSVVFCNVDEEGWPDYPMAFILSCAEDRDFLSQDEMVPWEPFEDFNADRLYDTVIDFQTDFMQAINDALTLERG